MIGKTISHYTILKKLGQGGMGTVYLAQDLSLRRKVAIKFLHSFLLDNKESRARFRTEAVSAASLQHENICQIYDYAEESDNAYIVMEYIDGQSLKTLLKEVNALQPDVAERIIRQIAAGLQHAHQKAIIHRDIKPDNIIIEPNGRVVITDFGLAKLKDQPKLTKTGTTLGTVCYMSPEQLRGENVGPETDLWSLGILFYETLSSALPFCGKSESAVISELLSPNPILKAYPKKLRPYAFIIARLLNKNKKTRFHSADALITALEKRSKWEFLQILRFRYGKTLARIFVVLLLLGMGGHLYTLFINAGTGPVPWLASSTKLVRLTSLYGDEMGRVSADGGSIILYQGDRTLYSQDIDTQQMKVLYEADVGQVISPVGSPDGNSIAFISDRMTAVSIYNYSTGGVRRLVPPREGSIYQVAWSPDSRFITYSCDTFDDQVGSGLYLVHVESGETHELFTRSPAMNEFKATWSPDGRYIAFQDYSSIDSSMVIRLVDLADHSVSAPLFHLNGRISAWFIGGMAFSPNGEWLIFADIINGYTELLAQSVNLAQQKIRGRPIPITRLAGDGLPAWPAFDSSGKRLSFNVIEKVENIYTANLNIEKKAISSPLVAVANNKEKERDACWSVTGDSIAYVKQWRGQYWIMLWQRTTDRIEMVYELNKPIKQLCFRPHRNALSFLRNDRLEQINLKSRKAEILFPADTTLNLRIHAYTWDLRGEVLYVSANTSRSIQGDSDILRIHNLKSATDTLISHAFIINTAGMKISPDGRFLAFYRYADDTTGPTPPLLAYLELDSPKERILTRVKTVEPVGDFSWVGDGSMILFDSVGDDLSAKRHFNVIDIATTTRHRLSLENIDKNVLNGPISSDQKNIILYENMMDADIWMFELE